MSLKLLKATEFCYYSDVKFGARFSIKAVIPSRRSFCNSETTDQVTISDRVCHCLHVTETVTAFMSGKNNRQ